MGKRNDTEHNEQVFVINWCETFKNKYPMLELIHAIPNGGHRHIAVAVKLKNSGVKSGVPDLCLPFPVATNETPDGWYHGLYIEMKSGKNKPTENQERFILLLRLARYRVETCYSGVEAVNVICDYLRIKEKIR